MKNVPRHTPSRLEVLINPTILNPAVLRYSFDKLFQYDLYKCWD